MTTPAQTFFKHQVQRCLDKQKYIDHLEQKSTEIQHEIDQIDETIRRHPYRYTCPTSRIYTTRAQFVLRQNNLKPRIMVAKRQLKPLIKDRDEAQIFIDIEDKLQTLKEECCSSAAKLKGETPYTDFTTIFKKKEDCRIQIKDKLMKKVERHNKYIKQLTRKYQRSPLNIECLDKITIEYNNRRKALDALAHL
jgi:hypothetical protein